VRGDDFFVKFIKDLLACLLDLLFVGSKVKVVLVIGCQVPRVPIVKLFVSE
jgi:hypothetical protein